MEKVQEDSSSIYGITNLIMMNLTIFNCSYWSFDSSVLTAVEIIESCNLTIINMVINETAGVGLQLTDLSGNTVINYISIDSSHNIQLKRWQFCLSMPTEKQHNCKLYKYYKLIL